MSISLYSWKSHVQHGNSTIERCFFIQVTTCITTPLQFARAELSLLLHHYQFNFPQQRSFQRVLLCIFFTCSIKINNLFPGLSTPEENLFFLNSTSSSWFWSFIHMIFDFIGHFYHIRFHFSSLSWSISENIVYDLICPFLHQSSRLEGKNSMPNFLSPKRKIWNVLHHQQAAWLL